MESFWSTEYGQNLLSVETTEMDKLLAADDTTLEELFDEDELLQQCSNKNSALISFLSQPESVRKLVSYITRPWPEQMADITQTLQRRKTDKAQRRAEEHHDTDNDKEDTLSIGEGDEDDDVSLNNHNNNDTQTQTQTQNKETPFSIANDLMSLEQNSDNNESVPSSSPTQPQPQSQDADASQPSSLAQPDEAKQDASQISVQSQTTESESVSKPATDATATMATTDNADDEFDRYDDLKLSDDDNVDEEDTAAADGDDERDIDADDIGSPDIDDEEKDTDFSPGLKKKKSVVDLLMDGPDADYADTESPDRDNNSDASNSPDADIDPELPDLNISGNSSTNRPAPDNSDNDIPPPPPPTLPIEEERLLLFASAAGQERVRLKYPYLASEILNCQIPIILDTMLSQFLPALFDFIFQSPPLNAVLTNYWRSCIVGLVRRNSNVVLAYIKSRAHLLSHLVCHIRDQSMMELVIALGWDPAIEELCELDEVADWMFEEQLVPKLISALSPERSPDEHSAASYTLVDIVAKTSRSTNLVLFHDLASATQIGALMEHMFAGNRSALLESLSVLLALLHHYPNVSAEKQHEVEVDDNDTLPAEDADADAEETEAEKEEKESDLKEEKVAEVDNVPAVVMAVCARLSDFKALLETPPARTLALPFATLSPPLGPVRHKVVDMIVALMRTPSKAVSEQLRSLGLIEICIDLFFAYPWNNLLHGSVEHIIQMVVSGECTILKTALFADCDFLTKILEARRLSGEHREHKKFRLGYMGHITRVSNTIVEFAKHNVQLDAYMQGNAEWLSFIHEELKLENEQLNTQLGGHRPNNGLSNLGSFGVGVGSGNGGGGGGDQSGNGNNGGDAQSANDFTLFTLNDDMDSNSNDEEDEEEEHSSDSDEQEDVDVEQQAQVVLTSQDAFQELTAEMDTAAEIGSAIGSGKEVSAEKKAKDAQFESWLNDEDGWADFDDKQDTKGTKDVDGNDRQKQSPQSQQLSNGNGSAKSHGDVDGGGDDKENNEEQSHPQPQQPQQEQSSVQQQQQPQPTVDDKDFANWDEDPFPDDDVFGAPEAAAAASSTSPDKAKEIVKDIEVVSDAAAEVAVDSAEAVTAAD